MWDVNQNYLELRGMEMYNLDKTKFCHKQIFTDILFQCMSCLMKDFSNGPHTTSWNNVMFKAEYEQESLFKKKNPIANMWSRYCHFMMCQFAYQGFLLLVSSFIITWAMQ